MLLEEDRDLLLERHLPMMLRLVLDVFHGVIDARDADAERPVALLPLERLMFWERLVNSFRGIAFDQLHGFRDGERGRQREENVNVIFHPANHQRLHPVLAGDAAEVRPEARLQFWLDERAAFFGGENTVHQAANE